MKLPKLEKIKNIFKKPVATPTVTLVECILSGSGEPEGLLMEGLSSEGVTFLSEVGKLIHKNDWTTIYTREKGVYKVLSSVIQYKLNEEEINQLKEEEM